MTDFLSKVQERWTRIRPWTEYGIDIRQQAGHITAIQAEESMVRVEKLQAALDSSNVDDIRAVDYQNTLDEFGPYGVVETVGRGELSVIEAAGALHEELPEFTKLINAI
jgi:hypothetical protein